MRNGAVVKMKWKLLLPTLIAFSLVYYFYNHNRRSSLKMKQSETETQAPHAPSRHVASGHPPAKPPNARNQPARLMTEEDFRRLYPGPWRLRRDPAGRITTLTGGRIPQAAANLASLRTVARQLSPLLAGGDYQLADEVLEASQTRHLKVFDIEQKVGDWKVYQGTLSFVANHEGDVYIVNNRLKEITPFEPAVLIGEKQAADLLQQRYPAATIQLKEGPLVFSDNRQPSTLAWIFHVRADAPSPLRRHVAVSASTGEVLHEEERLIHD